ncbi:MAG: apolipoprotein N-acyltransferase [Deltaproteobacteria bacterium]|nr:apolipoprotein N-acyltransferase [Deltaproteobacteria bacterium]
MTKRFLGAIISGILLILSFAPFGQDWLAFFAFVPFFYSLDGLGRRKGALIGIVFGFTFFLGTVYWVIHSMYFYGGVPIYISVFVMLLLVLYLSVYPAVFGALFPFFTGHGKIAQLVIMPAAWVTLEYLRGYLFTGFPWVLAGYTQTHFLPIIQIADVTGVWGVSFIVVLVNTALYFSLRYLLKKDSKFPLKEAAVTLAVIISVVSYGFLRISLIRKEMPLWTSIKAGVAQGSIDQGAKWDATFRQRTLEIYKAITINAGRAGARLIIWPETAVPFYFDSDEIKSGFVGDITRETGSYLLTGSPSYKYNQQTESIEYYNSAFLLSPSGDTLGRYDKIHLVPFGEYVPLKRFLPFIKKLTTGIGDFATGIGPVPIDFEGGGIGALICYESIFPEIAGRSVKNGATVLVNITNDGWFGKTSAPYQHFDMAIFRAVENKAYLLRAANTGISAVIDPIGKIKKRTKLFEKAALVDTISLRRGPLTFYSKYGDVFAYGCIIISGIFIILSIRRRRI